MAARKKTSKKQEKVTPTEEEQKKVTPIEEQQEKVTSIEEQEEPKQEKQKVTSTKVKEQEKSRKKNVTSTKTDSEKEPKYKIGSIVFVSKDADADLNGFKLFPQYKKYTYTVEAYEPKSDVYTLRRLNLSLKLKSAFIVAPDERAHDTINRKQF